MNNSNNMCFLFSNVFLFGFVYDDSINNNNWSGANDDDDDDDESGILLPNQHCIILYIHEFFQFNSIDRCAC